MKRTGGVWGGGGGKKTAVHKIKFIVKKKKRAYTARKKSAAKKQKNSRIHLRAFALHAYLCRESVQLVQKGTSVEGNELTARGTCWPPSVAPATPTSACG